jgi:hypothetical protein
MGKPEPWTTVLDDLTDEERDDRAQAAVADVLSGRRVRWQSAWRDDLTGTVTSLSGLRKLATWGGAPLLLRGSDGRLCDLWCADSWAEAVEDGAWCP